MFTRDNAAEDLNIIYTDTNFFKLVEASFDAEMQKVFNQGVENDLNRWELETREEDFLVLTSDITCTFLSIYTFRRIRTFTQICQARQTRLYQ